MWVNVRCTVKFASVSSALVAASSSGWSMRTLRRGKYCRRRTSLASSGRSSCPAAAGWTRRVSRWLRPHWLEMVASPARRSLASVAASKSEQAAVHHVAQPLPERPAIGIGAQWFRPVEVGGHAGRIQRIRLAPLAAGQRPDVDSRRAGGWGSSRRRREEELYEVLMWPTPA